MCGKQQNHHTDDDDGEYSIWIPEWAVVNFKKYFLRIFKERIGVVNGRISIRISREKSFDTWNKNKINIMKTNLVEKFYKLQFLKVFMSLVKVVYK